MYSESVSADVSRVLWLCCQLLMPADENLEEFWIDFNLGSNSISFYFSLADVDAQVLQDHL